jgi:hypothetical protein
MVPDDVSSWLDAKPFLFRNSTWLYGLAFVGVTVLYLGAPIVVALAAADAAAAAGTVTVAEASSAGYIFNAPLVLNLLKGVGKSAVAGYAFYSSMAADDRATYAAAARADGAPVDGYTETVTESVQTVTGSVPDGTATITQDIYIEISPGKDERAGADEKVLSVE